LALSGLIDRSGPADGAAQIIHLKPLWLAAQVRTSVRRTQFAVASGCPDQSELEMAYLLLKRAFDTG